jgi:hypothetical protein
MKKLLCLGLIFIGACSKKDSAPAYSDFTAVNGNFTVFEMGLFRHSGHDTTAVLTNLQLRIQPSNSNPNLDVYNFRRAVDASETIEIQFAAPKSQSHSGSWTNVQVDTDTYFNGKKTNTHGSGPTAGTLSANGNTFTASFDVSGARGTLK